MGAVEPFRARAIGWPRRSLRFDLEGLAPRTITSASARPCSVTATRRAVGTGPRHTFKDGAGSRTGEAADVDSTMLERVRPPSNHLGTREGQPAPGGERSRLLGQRGHQRRGARKPGPSVFVLRAWWLRQRVCRFMLERRSDSSPRCGRMWSTIWPGTMCLPSAAHATHHGFAARNALRSSRQGRSTPRSVDVPRSWASCRQCSVVCLGQRGVPRSTNSRHRGKLQGCLGAIGTEGPFIGREGPKLSAERACDRPLTGSGGAPHGLMGDAVTVVFRERSA